MPNVELDPAELAAWRGMLRAHRDLVGRLDDELRRDHGITLGTYEVLMLLGSAPDGHLRMGELADQLLISRSGLTRQIDRLERAGFARRLRCEDDGRGYFAEITGRGRDVLAAARPGHLDGVRRLFLNRLSGAEIQRLGAIWERLPAEGEAAVLRP